MQLTRRGFLGSILALAAAPAIVRADSLMRVVPRDTTVITFADIQAAGAQLDAAGPNPWSHLEYRVMYDWSSGRPMLRAYDRIEKIHANVPMPLNLRRLSIGGGFLAPTEVCKIDVATREEAQRLIDECKAARKGWSPRKA